MFLILTFDFVILTVLNKAETPGFHILRKLADNLCERRTRQSAKKLLLAIHTKHSE